MLSQGGQFGVGIKGFSLAAGVFQFFSRGWREGFKVTFCHKGCQTRLELLSWFARSISSEAWLGGPFPQPCESQGGTACQGWQEEGPVSRYRSY